MKKILCTAAICLALSAAPAYSHHPAADMVDAEVYAMIDALVADTPHAELVFDDEMGDGDDTTVITTDNVSLAEDMIDDGLLADLSLLDGDVIVTIEFSDYPLELSDAESISLTSSDEEPTANQTSDRTASRAADQSGDQSGDSSTNSWTEEGFEEWGRYVKITIMHTYDVME